MSQGSSSSNNDIKRLGGNAIATGTGATDNGTLRVQLSTESLAALENISITLPGTVDLGTVSLTALESITVTQSTAANLLATVSQGGSWSVGQSGTWNVGQSGTWNVALSAGSAAIGTVELGATSLAALETITVGGSLSTTQSGTWTVQPGNTANTTPWLIGIGDGTNTATIKAASTAAVAADKALVVAISPNNSLNVTGPLTDAALRASAVPVSLASLPSHAVTNIGTFAIQESGAALTALQLIDDAVATNSAAAVAKLIQVGGTDGTNAKIISVTSAGLVNIADGGGSLTVDGTVGVSGSVAVTGTFWQATQPVSVASIPSHPVTNAGTFVTQENGAALTALQLIDDSIISDNTVMGGTKMVAVGGTDGTNSQIISVTSGGLVNIADGGGSLTVDGTVGVSGSVAVTGTFWQATQPVSIATSVPITDNSGSLTVDAPVATPVFVRLSNGSAAVDTLPVSMTYSPKTNNTTTAYATSLVIKGSAGTLYMINAYISKTTDQFIQLFDSATLPADGTAPKLTFLAPAESNFYFDFGVFGRAFTTGIVVCNSSTGPTKTIGSADCWFDSQYT